MRELPRAAHLHRARLECAHSAGARHRRLRGQPWANAGYRTAPLKGLWTHLKGGFYHDGRFATLRDLVDHYDTQFGLHLSEQEKTDLVEYLKSL